MANPHDARYLVGAARTQQRQRLQRTFRPDAGAAPGEPVAAQNPGAADHRFELLEQILDFIGHGPILIAFESIDEPRRLNVASAFRR